VKGVEVKTWVRFGKLYVMKQARDGAHGGGTTEDFFAHTLTFFRRFAWGHCG